MNFRTALHLFRSRWQHQRLAVFVLWVLLLLMALPWLRHDPLNFTETGGMGVMSGGSGEIFDLLKPRSERQHWKWVRLFQSYGWMITFCFSAITGLYANRATGVRPIRRSEAALAEVLTILAFIAAPQLLLTAANLILHQFPLGMVAAGAATSGLSILLIHLVSARFAAWCGSFWFWLAGIAGVLLTTFLLGLLPGAGPSDRFQAPTMMMDLWGYQAGPRQWAFLGLVLMFLLAAWPWLRARLKPFARVACAAFLVALASALTSHLDQVFYLAQAVDSSGGGTTILHPEPVLGSMRVNQHQGRIERVLNSTISIAGEFDTATNPPESLVCWNPATDARISQGGVPLGTLTRPYANQRLQAKLPPIAAYFQNHWVTGLPGLGTADVRIRQRNPETQFGTTTLKSGSLHPSAPITLETELIGRVYRYQTVLDVELKDTPTTVRAGDTTFHIRKLTPFKHERVLADLTMSHPSLGWARSLERLHWFTPPIDRYRVLLYFPSSGLNYPTEPLYHSSGPMLGGAGWHRRIYGVDRSLFHRADEIPHPEGVRVVVLKPVLTGITPTIPITLQASAEEPKIAEQDYRSNQNYPLEPPVYLNSFLPKRPDPASCDKREFGKWLRVAGFTYMVKLNDRDLADYAPRFARTLARASFIETAANALRIGAPESQKGEILATFDSIESPRNLLNTLARRGWLEDVRQQAVQRFLHGDLGVANTRENVAEIASLEDPATYPALLTLPMNQESYEIIRQLPGIEPALTETLRKAHAKENPSRDAAISASWDFTLPPSYLFAACHGIPEAFADLLTIVQAAQPPGSHFYETKLKQVIQMSPGMGENARDWINFLKDKKASDFSYDTLARRWVLRTQP